MSTRIGIIAEGPIDHVLLPVLLERIARDRADFDWPVAPNDIAQLFQIRKRGHGGVLETVRKLVEALSSEVYDYSFYVILLDRRTARVQKEIRKLISRRQRFVLGIAIEEIEAWWLADRHSTLAWADLEGRLPSGCRYAQTGYQSERDRDPKKTLSELTAKSDRFDRTYGDGNLDMATEFAENHWRMSASLDELRAQCPVGYATFEDKATQAFRNSAHRQGRLFGSDDLSKRHRRKPS